MSRAKVLSEAEVTQAFREVFSGRKAAFVLSVLLDDLGFFKTEPTGGEGGLWARAFAQRILERLGINTYPNQVLMVESLLGITPFVEGIRENDLSEDE